MEDPQYERAAWINFFISVVPAGFILVFSIYLSFTMAWWAWIVGLAGFYVWMKLFDRLTHPSNQ